MKKLLLTLLAPVLFVSCSTGIYEIAATGKPYEIFVASDRAVWDGAVGDTLRSVFGQEVEWLNQPEPLFDLFNMTPEGMTDLIRRHRNLLIINVNSKSDSTSFTSTKDRWASGQVVVTINSPSAEQAAQYLSENRATIVSWFEILERERMSERAKKYNEATVTQLIKDKFGFSMIIPNGYRVRKDTTNFLWISYEMPLASQGVSIYTFKKKEGKLDLLAERDMAISQIPGPSDGSYMATDTTFHPDLRNYKINGRDWVEIRGFWNVKGDFMGGPFINYVTYDELNERYIAIDMYVLSPTLRYPKRNYIRQLESLMMNVKID